MDIKIVKSLSKFVRNVRRLKNLTPYEYVDKLLADKKYDFDDTEIEVFLSFIKHDQFLSKIADGFIKKELLTKASKFNLTIIMFILIFELNEDNTSDVVNILREMKNPNTQKLLAYFRDENNLIAVAQDACKIFANDYVLKNVIHPLLDKASVLESISVTLLEEQKRNPKPVTIPQKVQVLERKAKLPEVPDNSPETSAVGMTDLEARKIVYLDDKTIRKQLSKRYEENRIKALNLLEIAKKMAPRSYEFRKTRIPPSEGSTSIPLFKANKVPPKTNVPLKQNFTTLIREAAYHIKDQEKEIKRIEGIVQGGFDPDKFKKIEIEYRKLKEEECLADIEKKRLRCLITYEEAILAKKNLAKLNREKMVRYQLEKKSMLEEIEEWRREQEGKMREQVEKVREVEGNAREAMRNLQVIKLANARIAKYESKQLMEQLYADQERELAKKVELIKEIKTLNQLRSAHVKEFDPTECPNFGLLSEMSIAELQERLVLLAIQINQELQNKKKKIQNAKERHRQFVENAKKFIAQSRMSKPQSLPTSPSDSVNLDQDPDVVELRNRLEYVKHLRTST